MMSFVPSLKRSHKATRQRRAPEWGINSSADDYVYDANGNMVWDRNKGGQEHLTNGSFDNGSSGWTVTDPSSKLNFNNGKVDVTAGAGPYITQNVVIPNAPYVVIVDITRTAGSTMTVQVGSATQTLSTTGIYVLSMMSTNTNPIFRITIGGSWAGSINSVSLRGITAITYNLLNLPELVGNSSEQLRYIYDASGRKLCQNLYSGTTTPKKATDYAGEFIYQNDTLQFINTEEGRVIVKTATPEYQYHLKDHLGNVRVTFTATPEHELDTATLEDSHLVEDAAKFLRVSAAKRVNATIFDRTNGASTGYSQRLNGSTDEKFGLARSISVMPGDTVKAEVYAKYVDPNSSNWTGALATLIAQIASNASGVVYTGENYNSSTSTFPFPATQATTDNEDAPKAYLNWLVFDRNYLFIASKSGYQQLTTAAKEAGADVTHELLSSPNILITEPGYVYIYLSNEETTPVEVYFDDLKVRHTKSPVVHTDDYYPFGLAHSSYSRENSTEQDFKYNGKELQVELGLGWLDYGARMYMAEIGRWGVIDSKAEKYNQFAPYVYAINSPLIFSDPDGKEIYFVTSSGAVIAATTENLKNTQIAAAHKGLMATESGKATWNKYARNDQKDVYIAMSSGIAEGATINGVSTADLTGDRGKRNLTEGFEVFQGIDYSKSENKKIALIGLSSDSFSDDLESSKFQQAETLFHELKAHVEIDDEQGNGTSDTNHEEYGSPAGILSMGKGTVSANSALGKFAKQLLNSNAYSLPKWLKEQIQDVIKEDEKNKKGDKRKEKK